MNADFHLPDLAAIPVRGYAPAFGFQVAPA